MNGRRKLENTALALSIFGAIMMVPPLLSIFNIDTRLFGAPLVVIYLFTLWIVLIGATAFISSKLMQENKEALSDNNEKSSEEKN
jgi:hypothetical protein